MLWNWVEYGNGNDKKALKITNFNSRVLIPYLVKIKLINKIKYYTQYGDLSNLIMYFIKKYKQIATTYQTNSKTIWQININLILNPTHVKIGVIRTIISYNTKV